MLLPKDFTVIGNISNSHGSKVTPGYIRIKSKCEKAELQMQALWLYIVITVIFKSCSNTKMYNSAFLLGYLILNAFIKVIKCL